VPVTDEDQVRDLHAKIGVLAVANSFWKESSNPGAGSEARDD
jgi:transposase